MNEVTMRSMALAACVLFLQCGKTSPGIVDPAATRILGDTAHVQYAYTGYDRNGKEIVKGTLSLAVDDSGRISGTWDLALTDTTAIMIGPQVGEGTLVGEVRGEEAGINLNPDFVDNNVLLFGHFTMAGIAGVWQYVGFPVS